MFDLYYNYINDLEWIFINFRNKGKWIFVNIIWVFDYEGEWVIIWY